MTRSRSIVAAMSLASAVAVVAASPARAVDDKTVPGSNCVPANGNLTTGPRFFLNFSILLNGSATEALRADCPIIKERIGRGILSSSVFVVDNNPTQDVGCELVSVHVVTNAQISSQLGLTRFTAGSSPAVRRLDLGGLAAVSGIGSYWFIGCTLPPSTGVVSYYVNEQS